jgi:hypothetical protein
MGRVDVRMVVVRGGLGQGDRHGVSFGLVFQQLPPQLETFVLDCSRPRIAPQPSGPAPNPIQARYDSGTGGQGHTRPCVGEVRLPVS